MPRLFTAIPMPEEIADQLDGLCHGLPAIRWADPGAFHLTLRFLGEVEQGTFVEIGVALAAISRPPFDLRLKGLGTFPPRGAPQTLWAGVEPSEALTALRRRIDRALDAIGVAPDRRRFVPHVTIGRFRALPPEARFGSWLGPRALFRSSSFPVSRFALFSSVLRPEGPLHCVEADYDFVTGVMERA